MNNKKLGFIGNGNMAKAIMGGVIKSNTFKSKDIYVSGKTLYKLKETEANYKVNIESNRDVVKKSDIIIIAVKPNKYKEVLEEINDIVDGKIIIDIAAGISIDYIENLLGKDKKIIRVMPNTPVLVGEGMTSISINKNIKEDELENIMQIFNSLGKTELVDEDLIDCVIGISGSSPAYIYMIIEAMADAVVEEGMSYDTAYKMAAQSVLGSAKMVLETGEHPAKLKNDVSSPGGTTIAALNKFEEEGLRKAIILGVRECINKSKSM